MQIKILSFVLFVFSCVAFANDLRPSSSDKIMILKIKGAETVPVMKAFPKIKGVEDKLYQGDELVVGDEVRVSANVVVQLRQWDGSNYFLAPNSQYKVDACVPDKQSCASWTFALTRGAIRGQVTDSEPGKESAIKIMIKTPSAVVGARGTEFFVSYTPDGPTRVFVRKGEALFGRSEKFEPRTFVTVKEKMTAEAAADRKQKIAPPQENANAFDEAMKNVGIPEAINEVPEGRLPQSISACRLKGMGWREAPGMGPLGECF